jgi:hypothetical protein
MVHRRERPGLALEAGHAAAVEAMPIGKDLQGDVALEPDVVRTIDLAHGTRPESVHDLVRTQPIASL